MKDDAMTRRVLKKLSEDLKASGEVVGPLMLYTENNFPTLEERLRFLILVTFSACNRAQYSDDEIVDALPSALTDIYQHITDAPLATTVH